MLFFFWASCRIRTNDPEITNHVLWPTELKRQVGKLTISRRYNQLPLLRSSPGGFEGSWPYRTYPGAKVGIFIKPAIGDRYFFACFTGKLLLFRYLKSKKKCFFSDRIALLTLTGINSIPTNIICTFVRYLLIKWQRAEVTYKNMPCILAPIWEYTGYLSSFYSHWDYLFHFFYSCFSDWL